jgi:Cyclophilin type peptidyl-prolyl cis-trans isomerase/CLD
MGRDPLCGPNGELREALVGQAVPSLKPGNSDKELRITHVVAMRIQVGREESGILRMGLYGDDAPVSVDQLLEVLSLQGLTTLSREDRQKEYSIGSITEPVSLLRGGVITTIVPRSLVELGVPSQSYAYARSRGLSKVGSDFLPQPRSPKELTSSDGIARLHDCAGLVSVPKQGIGYGGSGFESDDEAYASAFSITSASLPSLDASRRVIGQILDASSMAFLERLVSLPTQRGIRGVIPGQTSGPPLIKTLVREIVMDKVAMPS